MKNMSHICCRKALTPQQQQNQTMNFNLDKWRAPFLQLACVLPLSMPRRVCVFGIAALKNLEPVHFFHLLTFFFLCSLLVLRCCFLIPRYLNGSHVMQLGGVNENISYEYPQLQHKHYTGCLRNLRVDTKVLCGTCRIDFTRLWMNRFPCCVPLCLTCLDDGSCTVCAGGLRFNSNVRLASKLHCKT